MKTLTKTYLGYNYKAPKLLYHYCSVEVLKSILCNKSIWLSDSYKTNDSTELYWLLLNTKDIFGDIMKENIEKYKPEILKDLDLYLYYIDIIIDKYKMPNQNKIKKFITCFSERGDLLSQWRAYGNDGFGVSIGFDTKFLLSFEDLATYEFTKIIYSEKKVKAFMKELIGEQLKYIFMDVEFDESETTFQKIKFELSRLIASIYDEGFIFKEPSFSEEKEWRLTRKATISNWNKDDGVDEYGFSSLIEGLFVDILNGDYNRSKLKFRTTNDDLIPYIELGFEKIKSEFIKEIILGPKCKIDKYDLLLLLNSEDYIDTVYDENIRIIKSNISYV